MDSLRYAPLAPAFCVMFNMINKLIKVSVGIIFLVILIQTVTIFQFEDDFLLVRSANPMTDNLDRLTPSWLAKTKLKVFGLNSCLLPKRDNLPAIPVVSFLVGGYGVAESDSETIDDLVIWAVSQGCNVNSRDYAGLLPIHVAILFKQPEVVLLLIGLGADLYMTADRPGSEIDEMNAFEFSDLMSRKDPNKKRDKIIKLLNDSKKT